MKINNHLTIICMLSMGALASCQEDAVRAKAREVLSALGHEALLAEASSFEWMLPDRPSRTRPASLASKHWRMAFSVAEGQVRLMRFSWHKRQADMKRREAGQYPKTEAEYWDRGYEILRRLGHEGLSNDTYREGTKTAFGNETNSLDGGVNLQFKRIVNGVNDAGGGAEINFDAKDGSVIGVRVTNRIKPYEPRGNEITAAQATQLAYEKVCANLRETKPAEYAETMIARMDAARPNWQTSLCYSSVGGDFDEDSARYIGLDAMRPLVYQVTMDQMHITIHAKTGKSLGGGVYTSSPIQPQPTKGKPVAVPKGVSPASSYVAPGTAILVAVSGLIVFLRRRRRG